MSKLQTVIIFMAVFLMCACQDYKDAVITNYEYERGPSNSYHFGFDTSDGTSRSEDGRNNADDTLAVDGTISWVADDGSRYQMIFRADKKGFRPIIKRISGP
ncbi:endocuticle structural protein SgAbd-6-like [Arctopsyche grandis]|uniref:endocuticle structural protein SgAbd-6-like n=1 Tax=Arctopsyche grandis TaxID=121162 RepID=UPI00406D9618